MARWILITSKHSRCSECGYIVTNETKEIECQNCGRYMEDEVKQDTADSIFSEVTKLYREGRSSDNG